MKRNQQLFSFASLVNGISFSMILPLLAPLIRQFNLSELQGGVMVSAGALFMAIAALYIGKYQHQYSVYSLLWVGFLGMSLTWALFSGVLMYGILTQATVLQIFILLVIARASTGIFMALPPIALQTYVMTHHAHEHARSQVVSKFGALNSLGMILGPFLTSLFLVGGMLTPLWIAVMLLMLMTVFIFTCYDRADLDAHSRSVQASALAMEQTRVFDLKSMALWWGLGFYVYLAIVTLNLTAGFYLQDFFQLSPNKSAVYFSQCSLLVGGSLVLMQWCIAKRLRWSVYRLLSIGIMAMAIGLIVTLVTPHLRIFQATYVFYGIAIACLIPAFTTGAAQNARPEQQAKVASACTAIQAMSFIVGPLISTGLYQYHSIWPYYFLVLGLLMLSVYALWHVYTQRRITLRL